MRLDKACLSPEYILTRHSLLRMRTYSDGASRRASFLEGVGDRVWIAVVDTRCLDCFLRGHRVDRER